MVAYSYSIVGGWRNCFSQVFIVLWVNDVRQTHSRTTSAFEVEVAIGKLKDTNHQVLIKSQQN